MVQIITNKQFTKAFAKAMWRPAFIPLPEFAVNLIFSSERAKVKIYISNKNITLIFIHN